MKRYLISYPGQVARFIAGPYDPRDGRENVVEGGYILEVPDEDDE